MPQLHIPHWAEHTERRWTWHSGTHRYEIRETPTGFHVVRNEDSYEKAGPAEVLGTGLKSLAEAKELAETTDRKNKVPEEPANSTELDIALWRGVQDWADKEFNDQTRPPAIALHELVEQVKTNLLETK